jgi:hypothetical protein
MIPPPRTAELLLEALGARTDVRDAVLGDLAEEFALRAERDGIRRARRWYYREAVRTAPHLLRDWSRGLTARDAYHLAGVVLTSYVFMTMLGVLFVNLARGVMMAFGRPPGAPLLVSPSDALLAAIGLPLGAVAATTGGYIAAWLHDRAPLISALALGVTWSCVAVSVSTFVGGVPGWYQLGVPVVLILGTAAGGMLRVRTPRSTTASASAG